MTILSFLLQATPHVNPANTPYADTVTPEWSTFTKVGATIFALIIAGGIFYALYRARNAKGTGAGYVNK